MRGPYSFSRNDSWHSLQTLVISLKALAKAASPSAAAEAALALACRLEFGEVFPDGGLGLAVGYGAVLSALGKQFHVFVGNAVDVVHGLGGCLGIERLHAFHHLTPELGRGADDVLHQMAALLDGGSKILRRDRQRGVGDNCGEDQANQHHFPHVPLQFVGHDASDPLPSQSGDFQFELATPLPGRNASPRCGSCDRATAAMADRLPAGDRCIDIG
jgi:hypothetical protein